MNTTGALRKVFTDIAWGSLEDRLSADPDDHTVIDANDTVAYVSETIFNNAWDEGILSKAVFEALLDDKDFDQFIHNVIDWDELRNRVDEREAELFKESEELASDQMSNRIAMWGA